PNAATLAASGRSTGSRQTARSPSPISVRTSACSDTGRAAGSLARIPSSDAADTTNETASTRTAPGAVISCVSHPAVLNAPNSATDALAVSLLLPSTSSSYETSVGRYD